MINKLFTKTNLILLLILSLGLFLRTYQLRERFLYGHDQDLAGWVIKDVVVNRHFRLIGQETSTQGIFIGPLFYYLQIPFYLLTGMDPIGGTYLFTILGLITIVSIYFIFTKVFDRNTGLIGALVYAISFYTIYNDREAVPTMPVILWSVWFFYALNLLLQGKQKLAYIFFGILIGLIWHLNFALILPVVLIPIAFYLSKAKYKFKDPVAGIFTFFVVSLPLLLFELRHGFQQAKAIYYSITIPQSDVTYSGYQKLERVWLLMTKNVSGLFIGSLRWFNFETISLAMILVFAILVLRKKISKNLAILMFLWI